MQTVSLANASATKRPVLEGACQSFDIEAVFGAPAEGALSATRLIGEFRCADSGFSALPAATWDATLTHGDKSLLSPVWEAGEGSIVTTMAGKPNPKFILAGRRLRAARLAAGYIVSLDAATVLGLYVVTYRSMEYGTHKPDKEVLASACIAFGVSDEFFSSGATGKGANDQLAAELVSVLSDSPEADIGRASRLITMRSSSGFPTGSAAARTLGWKIPTYLAHESGLHPIPVDRMIGYALAFGFSPKSVLAGDVGARMELSGLWKEKERVPAKVIKPKYIPWAWCRDLRRREGRRLTVLDIDNSGLGISDFPGITLTDAEAPPKSVKAFAVAEDAGQALRVTLIEVRQPLPGETGVAALGDKVIEHSDIPKKILDPLLSSPQPGVPIPLGTKFRVITMPRPQKV